MGLAPYTYNTVNPQGGSGSKPASSKDTLALHLDALLVPTFHPLIFGAIYLKQTLRTVTPSDTKMAGKHVNKRSAGNVKSCC